MRTNNSSKIIFSESTLPRGSADIYHFGERGTENGRRRLIKALEQENALLTQMVSDLGIEITRVRQMLDRG